MTLFIQNDATGAGTGSLDANQAAVDLAVIANGDTGLGLGAQTGDRQQVTYTRSDPGIPPTRLDTLVNTNFNPDYGLGAGPQAVPIVILPVLANFVRNDGRSILAIGGTSLPPSNSGLPGAGLNNTTDCLVIYDTTQNNGAGYCVARGTTATLDLQSPNPVILYHELSHAFRIATNAQLALTVACNPSSAEERAAITDENDLRTQIANAMGVAPVLRNSGNHCGAICTSGSSSNGCCIVASVASGSPLSNEVASLRRVRDEFLRKSEVGFAFFDTLHRDYYGFSPQVCTLLARHQTLRPLILEGFVRPLVTILSAVEERALGNADAAALARQFAASHPSRDEAETRLELLRHARSVLDGDEAELPDEQRELAELLSPALRSDHLVWGVVESVELYGSALTLYLEGCTEERLGEHLQAGIELWATRMPLDAVWESLTTAELQEELGLLDSTLLRTPDAKTRFRERLTKEFRVTATHGLANDGTAKGETE